MSKTIIPRIDSKKCPNCTCTFNNSLLDVGLMSWMTTLITHCPAHLLLDKYWPIFSWLFHSSLCRAKTFPSLIKDRLWLSESLAGQSEAMSRKNLEENPKVTPCWWHESNPEAH